MILKWTNYLTNILKKEFFNNSDIKVYPSIDRFHFTSKNIIYFLEIYYKNKYSLTLQQRKLINRKNNQEFLTWVLLPKEFDYKKFDLRWLILISGLDEVILEISNMKISKLKKVVVKSLKEKHDSKLSEIYWKYFN